MGGRAGWWVSEIWCTHALTQFIQSLTYLAFKQPSRPPIHPPTPPHAPRYSHCCLRSHSPTHSLTHSLTHSCTHSFMHSLMHSLTYSLTHPCTHSLTHSLTHMTAHLQPREVSASPLYTTLHTHRRHGQRPCGAGERYMGCGLALHLWITKHVETATYLPVVVTAAGSGGARGSPYIL